MSFLIHIRCISPKGCMEQIREVVLILNLKKTQTKHAVLRYWNLHLQIKTYFFARYYSQLKQSSEKKNPFLKRTAATLQGAVWVIMKKLFQTKLYKFPKKEFYLVFNNNAFPNWSKHLEKGMHFSKDPKAMSQDFKGYCVLLLNSSFPKEIKDECSFQLKQQFWKSHMFLKKHAATLQECCIL